MATVAPFWGPAARNRSSPKPSDDYTQHDTKGQRPQATWESDLRSLSGKWVAHKLLVPYLSPGVTGPGQADRESTEAIVLKKSTSSPHQNKYTRIPGRVGRSISSTSPRPVHTTWLSCSTKVTMFLWKAAPSPSVRPEPIGVTGSRFSYGR